MRMVFLRGRWPDVSGLAAAVPVGRRWRRWALAILVLSTGPAVSGGQGLLAGQGIVKPIQAVVHRHAAMITIRGPIDQITWESVRRRVTVARKLGCSLIIYRLNSAGGMLAPALKISQFTRHIGLPTVAYISGSAIGPAALIAVSCRQIIMGPRANLGDGQAFALRGALARQAAAHPQLKSTSAAWQDLQASARANGYPILALLAMVDRSVRLDEMTNLITHQRRFVTPAQRHALLRRRQAGPGGAAVHPWHFVRRVKKGGTLLLAGPRLGRRLGLAQATAMGSDDLPALLNITGRLEVLRLDFWERLARWLAEPEIRFILLVIMVVAGYIEFSHPGLLVPGVIALAALGLLFGGPLITGLANWWEIALVILGVAIIIFDIVHFGGLGLLAIPGLILVLIGLVSSFASLGTTGMWHSLQTGGVVVAAALVCSSVIIILLARYLEITPGLRRLALQPMPAPDPARLFREPATVGQTVFVGAVGRAVSDLRPAGKARFDEQLIDVVAQGEFIARATVVEITEIKENQVVVIAAGRP